MCTKQAQSRRCQTAVDKKWEKKRGKRKRPTKTETRMKGGNSNNLTRLTKVGMDVVKRSIYQKRVTRNKQATVERNDAHLS